MYIFSFFLFLFYGNMNNIKNITSEGEKININIQPANSHRMMKENGGEKEESEISKHGRPL